MYLPKHKYKSNLHTPGEELELISTGANYIGPYFETYLGTYFTGKEPSAETEELRLQQNTDNNGREKSPKSTYDFLRDSEQEVLLKNTLPVPLYYPRPSTEKTLIRYFAIDKTNQRVVEVSKSTYLSMKSKEPKYYYPKYELKTLDWSLTNVSENRVNAAVAGLDSYLKNPSQFVR